MDLASKICVVCCILYNMVDVVTVSLLTVVLPKILYPQCTNTTNDDNHFLGHENWTECEDKPWEQPGLVLSVHELAAWIFCLPLGSLSSRFNTRYIFTFGLLIHALGSYILSIEQTFVYLIFGNFFDGFGCIIGAVTFTDILRRIFPKDSTRCRILNIVTLGRVIGYATGFFICTVMYETFGPTITFASIASAFVIQAFAMIFAIYLDKTTNQSYERLRLIEETSPIYNNNDHFTKRDIWSFDNVKPLINTTTKPQEFQPPTKSVIQPKDTRFIALFKSLPNVTIYFQYFFTHFSLATVMATAPSRLQIEVGFTTVENGLMTGLALSITFFMVLLLLIFVKSNKVRVIGIIFFVSIEITGVATYPFTFTFVFALFSESCIHMARNGLNSLGSSLLMLITDHENLDYAKANGIYILVRYGSQAVGSFLSVFLLELIGFRGLYMTLVGCLVPVALSSVIYFRLIPNH